MNSEPCVKFGMRISPKISENPADSKNSRPPKATLLTVRISQNVIDGNFPRSFVPQANGGRRFRRRPPSSSWLERRVVARVDRLRQELSLVVGPELTDVVVGLDRLVPELEVVLGAFLAELSDIEVTDHVAQVVELDRAARRVGQVDAPHGGDELGLVAGIAAK